MKYAIEEWRVGRSERIGIKPREWTKANALVRDLKDADCLREYRIVRIDEDEPSDPDLPEASRTSHHSG